MVNGGLLVRLGARGAFYSSSVPNASAEEQFPYLLFKPAVKDTIKALLSPQRLYQVFEVLEEGLNRWGAY